MKTALVVGALGVIGWNLTEYLSQRLDWNVIGLSRRLPDFKSRARHASVDLLKDADTAAQAKEWKHVTHVFYAAY